MHGLKKEIFSLSVQDAVTMTDLYHILSGRMQFVSSCVANYDIRLKPYLQAVSWQVHCTLAHLPPQ